MRLFQLLGRHRGLLHLATAVAALGLILGSAFWQSWNRPVLRIDPVPANGVAVLDELSLFYPDTSFISQVKEMVEASGFWLQYYSPDQVTVPLFWALPALGYEVVIIRAHATGWVRSDRVTIFTGEPYQKGMYYSEQTQGLVSTASTFDSGQSYYTVTPKFIGKQTQGTFPGTIIIMMGCTGLKNGQMAGAFTSKGASSYVSWNNQVRGLRTDLAILSLVQGLFQLHLSLGEALARANQQVGQDAALGSELGLYPDNATAVHVEA